MKEYPHPIDGTPVIEFDLSDWQNGPRHMKGKFMPAFDLDYILQDPKTYTIPHPETGNPCYYYVSMTEFEKIAELIRKRYWDRIEGAVNAAKAGFVFRTQNAPDRKAAIRDEIRFVSWQLEPNLDPNAPQELGKNPSCHVKGAYRKLQKSERDFEDPHYDQIRADTLCKYREWLRELQQQPDIPATPQSIEGGKEDKREPPQKAITFTDPATIEAIHKGLKAFFPERESDLLTLLNGGEIDRPLHFPDQQNRLAEVFSRAYYNHKMGGTKTDVKAWIVRNFTYKNTKKGITTSFSPNTLRGIFNPTGKGEVSKAKRIPIAGLEYVAPENRDGYAVR
jgi:hypothetical protein